VPVSGLLAGWLLLGEALDGLGWLACVLVFGGLAITVLPWPLRRLRQPVASQ